GRRRVLALPPLRALLLLTGHGYLLVNRRRLVRPTLTLPTDEVGQQGVDVIDGVQQRADFVPRPLFGLGELDPAQLPGAGSRFEDDRVPRRRADLPDKSADALAAEPGPGALRRLEDCRGDLLRGDHRRETAGRAHPCRQ